MKVAFFVSAQKGRTSQSDMFGCLPRKGAPANPICLGVRPAKTMNDTFEGLARRISPTLKKITYKLNGHFTFFNEEDLFQEALLHLWQDYNCAKLNDKTDSYILQGCYFHLKNYIRCVKNKVKLISIEAFQRNEEESNLDEFLWLRDAKADDFVEDLDSRLLCETIQNNGLTEKEKEILHFYSQGLTTRDIGKQLGISHVRVIKLTQRIREKSSKYIL